MTSIPKALKPREKNRATFVSEETKIIAQKSLEGKVLFSFFHLDTLHDLFNCGNAKDGWFIHLMNNLKEISKLNRNEFVVQQRQHYDVHPIDWDKAECDFILPEGMFEQLKEDKCLQFRLSSSGGRIHGFMIDETFYIIWLDPHHNLCPDQKFGGSKYYDAPLTPYQELELELEKLYQDNLELMLMLDEKTG